MSGKYAPLFQLAVWLVGLGFGLVLINTPVVGLTAVPQTLLLLLTLYTLAGLATLWLLHRHGRSLLTTPLDLGWLLVLLALVATTAVSLDPSRSIRVLGSWAALIVLFYTAVALFRSGWQVATAVKALLIIIGLLELIGLLLLAQRLHVWLDLAPGGWPPLRVVRLAGLTNNPNPFAALLAIALVLALGYRRQAARPWAWPLTLFLLLTPVALLLTGSRSGWLALTGGLLAAWFAQQPTRRRAAATAVLTLFALGLIALLTWWLRPETLAGSTAVDRQQFWQIALAMTRSAPFTGTGPGTFASAYLQTTGVPPAPLYVAAHSFWLDTVGEMGLLGLTAVGVVLVLLARLLWQTRHAWHGWTPALLGSLAALCLFGLFDTPWFQLRLLGALLLGALVATLAPAARSRTATAVTWTAVWLVSLAAGGLIWWSASAYSAGVAATQRGDWSAAAAAFDTARSRLPWDDTAVTLAAGFAHGQLVELPEAIAAYEAGIGREPGWALNYLNLAALYRQAGRPADASTALAQARARIPASDLPAQLAAQWAGEPVPPTTAPTLAAAIAAGYAALDAGEWEAAVGMLETAVGAHPTSAAAHTGLGVAYALTGQLDHARAAWRRAALLPGLHAAYAVLWLDATSDSPPADIANRLDVLAMGDALGLRTHGRAVGSYVYEVFLRLPPAGLLLPQLDCPQRSPLSDQHAAWLAKWVGEHGRGQAAARMGDRTETAALASCRL